jgi:cyclopropane-fatty-acyl-phospholipid synthase
LASREDIERTYDFMDGPLRLSLGAAPDLSCAFYNGDYAQTLEQAQHAKHEYVLRAILFRPPMRVLDIGCGWGPMLRAIHAAGGHGVGITLSRKQADACRSSGLEAHVRDWRDTTAETFGRFDGVISLGAFEHFCSPEEYREGRQDSIYRRFFGLCHCLLPGGGRLYLQTMVWDSPVVPEQLSLAAPKDSDAYVLGLLGYFYPGSWLPYGKEQICRNAPGFRLVSSNSGRKDYIQTMNEWSRRRIWRTVLRRPGLAAPLVARYLTDGQFRRQMESLRRSCNRVCLERGIMDHQRLVFEKV